MDKTLWTISIVTALTCSALFNGCSNTMVVPNEQTTQKMSAIGTDLAKNIRNSKLKFQLNGTNGVNGTLYLYTKNEKVQKATDPTCYGATGDPIRSGQYDLYLEQGTNSRLIKQNVPLFSDQLLEFNDNHPLYQFFTDSQKQLPDLLMLAQQTSCNGQLIALLTLSADGKSVQQLHFQDSTSSKQTIFISKVKRIAPDQFQTTAYDNSKSTYTTIAWKWIPDQNVWKEQQSTSDN